MHFRQYGVVKYLLIVIGLFLVAIGVIGIFVPGLPTTIFLIAAAACFAKSSPWLHNWLISHSWFGPIIKNWQETKSIPRKAKIIALLMMLFACVYSWWMIEALWLKLSIFIVMIFPAVFVFRLPLTENIAKNKVKEPQLNPEK